MAIIVSKRALKTISPYTSMIVSIIKEARVKMPTKGGPMWLSERGLMRSFFEGNGEIGQSRKGPLGKGEVFLEDNDG